MFFFQRKQLFQVYLYTIANYLYYSEIFIFKLQVRTRLELVRTCP